MTESGLCAGAGCESAVRRVLDGLPSFIVWRDAEGRFCGCNRQFADFWGVSGEALARHAEGLEDLPPELEWFLGRLASGTEGRTPPFEITRGETRKWLSLHQSTLRRDDGSGARVLYILDDITEQKHCEAELLKREGELEKAVRASEELGRAKTDFLSRMSHELRTPMNAILGMTRIAMGVTDPEQIGLCLRKIENSSKQMMSLIHDILDMSKLSANKMEAAAEEFQLSKTLTDVRGLITALAEEKGQCIHFSRAEDVPELLIGDEPHLLQILTNLLSNAVKFTPEGGSAELAVTLQRRTGTRAELEFAVTDTGIGIPPEEQERLFSSFEQADGGMARRYGGSGLGLPICKTLTELLGGEITMESVPEQGSRFIVRLPFQTRDTASCAGRRTEGSRSLGEGPLPAESVDPADFLPYIDVEEGMKRARDNRKLFCAMLQSFSSHGVYRDLEAALLAGDAPNAVRHAGLMSVLASNLSLGAIRDSAAEMEDVIQRGLYRQSHWQALDEVYRRTLEAIDHYTQGCVSDGNNPRKAYVT